MDGIHVNVRLEDPENKRQCILVVMDATQAGRKELLAVQDGYRESEQSWRELLLMGSSFRSTCGAGSRGWAI